MKYKTRHASLDAGDGPVWATYSTPVVPDKLITIGSASFKLSAFVGMRYVPGRTITGLRELPDRTVPDRTELLLSGGHAIILEGDMRGFLRKLVTGDAPVEDLSKL